MESEIATCNSTYLIWNNIIEQHNPNLVWRSHLIQYLQFNHRNPNNKSCSVSLLHITY